MQAEGELGLTSCIFSTSYFSACGVYNVDMGRTEKGYLVKIFPETKATCHMTGWVLLQKTFERI
jgi:hypothetical protein